MSRRMSEKQLLEYVVRRASERREKLIVLIQEAVGGCAYYWAARIADHLAEHGVYVEEADSDEQ